jgi:hypothetical protein
LRLPVLIHREVGLAIDRRGCANRDRVGRRVALRIFHGDDHAGVGQRRKGNPRRRADRLVDVDSAIARRTRVIAGPLGLAPRRKTGFWKWLAWSAAIILAPTVAFGAYAPAALLSANNLSDLASAATAWTNLGGGTAGKKAATDNSKANVASVTGSFTIGHLMTAADTAGTAQDGGLANPGVTVATYISNTASLTLGTTNNNLELIAQATPAALTVNLPTVASVSSGFTTCVKDKANTFATNNATVKTTDSSTIDGVAGATGYVMNQSKQGTCFVTDATSWFVQ